MDNRTIEEVRKNETKLINEIKVLEQQYKKQKEVIDKTIEYIKNSVLGSELSDSDSIDIKDELLDILKGAEND